MSDDKKATAYLNIGLKNKAGAFLQVGKYGIPLFEGDPLHDLLIACMGEELKVIGQVRSATSKRDLTGVKPERWDDSGE